MTRYERKVEPHVSAAVQRAGLAQLELNRRSKDGCDNPSNDYVSHVIDAYAFVISCKNPFLQEVEEERAWAIQKR